MDDMQLGNRQSYLWRAAANPSNNSKTISSNKFACLDNLDQDKRMPPLSLSESRSTGPRECSRDYKSYDGRGSRNGTHQSGSASSRESHPLLDNSQSRNISMLTPVLKSASQSGAISHKAPMSEQEFTKAYNSILKHYLEEPIVENTGLEIQQRFDNATFAKFTRECINHVLDKSPTERELVSKLLSHLLRQTILPVECFKNGLEEVLEIVDYLVIDVPKIGTYLAEILSHSIEDGAISLSELKSTCISLRRHGFVGKFLGELMTKVSRNKGPKWLADKWDQSGLQLSNLIDPERENVDKIIQEYPLMDDMQLGNRQSYLWRAAANPSNNSKTISSNKFACLDNLDQDKRMPPLSLSGSRSTGPRECSRDYKSYDGRGSRNGTHQSGSASSRESHPLLDNSQSRNISMLTPVLKSASQSGTISHKAPMSEQEFTKAYNSILKHYLEEPIVENTGLEIQQRFDNATFAKFTRECINHVLDKSPTERELVSKLLSHLLRQTILPVECFRNGLEEVLEIVDDLVIDIPKIWTYLAEILSHSIEDGAISLSELKSTCISLRRQGFVGKFLGELMTKVSRNKGPKWLADKWDQSGLQLSNLIDPERENVDKIIQEYNLEFLTRDYNSAEDSAATEQLSLEKIQENLTRLMKKNTSFDEICSWITANVGSREKDPKFIRHLMTAILETTLERHHGTWKLNRDTFASLQTLIQRFVDEKELLELQCLYAIQRYINKKIEFPPSGNRIFIIARILVPIMNRLWMDNVISSEAFLTWQKKTPEGADVEGHSVSVLALTPFFAKVTG